MFPYDPQLRALLQIPPASIADVLATMQAIDGLTIDGDGLKWFNWLYYQVTKLGETGWQKSDWVDRCLFILGSVAVLTKGLKDVWEDEGI